GTTAGGGQHLTSCTANGPDKIIAVTAAADGFLTASLDRNATSFDSVLSVSTACSEVSSTPQLICADSFDFQANPPLKGGETLSIRAAAGKVYYLIIDGYRATDAGTFQLTLSLSAGNCVSPVPFPLWPGMPMHALGSTALTNNVMSGSCGGLT